MGKGELVMFTKKQVLLFLRSRRVDPDTRREVMTRFGLVAEKGCIRTSDIYYVFETPSLAVAFEREYEEKRGGVGRLVFHLV